jgi:hypothetical protein
VNRTATLLVLLLLVAACEQPASTRLRHLCAQHNGFWTPKTTHVFVSYDEDRLDVQPFRPQCFVMMDPITGRVVPVDSAGYAPGPVEVPEPAPDTTK